MDEDHGDHGQEEEEEEGRQGGQGGPRVINHDIGDSDLVCDMMTTMARFRKEDSEHDVGGDVVLVGFFSNRSLSREDN